MIALLWGALLIVVGGMSWVWVGTRAGEAFMHDLLPCDEPGCCDFPRSNLRLVQGGAE